MKETIPHSNETNNESSTVATPLLGSEESSEEGNYQSTTTTSNISVSQRVDTDDRTHDEANVIEETRAIEKLPETQHHRISWKRLLNDIPPVLSGIGYTGVTYSQFLLTCYAVGLLERNPEWLKQWQHSLLLLLSPTLSGATVTFNHLYDNHHAETSSIATSTYVTKRSMLSLIIGVAALTHGFVTFTNLGYVVNQYGLVYREVPAYFWGSVIISLGSVTQFLLQEGKEALRKERKPHRWPHYLLPFAFALATGILGASESFQGTRWILGQVEDADSARHFVLVLSVPIAMLYFTINYSVSAETIIAFTKDIIASVHGRGHHTIARASSEDSEASTSVNALTAVAQFKRQLSQLKKQMRLGFFYSLGYVGAVNLSFQGFITAFGAFHEWLYITKYGESPPVPPEHDESSERDLLPAWQYWLVSMGLFLPLAANVGYAVLAGPGRTFLTRMKQCSGRPRVTLNKPDDASSTTLSETEDRPTLSPSSPDYYPFYQLSRDVLHMSVIVSVKLLIDLDLKPQAAGSFRENAEVALLTAGAGGSLAAVRLLAKIAFHPTDHSGGTHSREAIQLAALKKSGIYSIITLFLLQMMALTTTVFTTESLIELIPGDDTAKLTNAQFMAAILAGGLGSWLYHRFPASWNTWRNVKQRVSHWISFSGWSQREGANEEQHLSDIESADEETRVNEMGG